MYHYSIMNKYNDQYDIERPHTIEQFNRVYLVYSVFCISYIILTSSAWGPVPPNTNPERQPLYFPLCNYCSTYNRGNKCIEVEYPISGHSAVVFKFLPDELLLIAVTFLVKICDYYVCQLGS